VRVQDVASDHHAHRRHKETGRPRGEAQLAAERLASDHGLYRGGHDSAQQRGLPQDLANGIADPRE
jgi:hypothetical protein